MNTTFLWLIFTRSLHLNLFMNNKSTPDEKESYTRPNNTINERFAPDIPRL